MKDNFHEQHRPKTIWVFRTSVSKKEDATKLKPVLNSLMQQGDKWNFDLEDCDHILRVETKTLAAMEIIYQLEKEGYYCAELEDENNFSESTPFVFFQNSPPTPLFSKMISCTKMI